MPGTAVVVVEADRTLEARRPAGGSFLEAVVDRLSAQYGADPGAVRTLATGVLATFAGARVQSFVPILVEKRVREVLRRRYVLGTVPAQRGEPRTVPG